MQGPARYEYTSMNIPNESKHGFWGVLARKAKAILEEDNGLQNFESQDKKRTQMPETSTDSQVINFPLCFRHNDLTKV